jgi:hypothetical protein
LLPQKEKGGRIVIKYRWGLALLSLALVLSLSAGAVAGASETQEYVEGEVIALLKNGTGTSMANAMSNGSVRPFAVAAAAKAGGKLEKIYESLSAQSGYVYMMVKSDTLTTEELLKKLKENPDVISVSPNYIYPARELPIPPVPVSFSFSSSMAAMPEKTP